MSSFKKLIVLRIDAGFSTQILGLFADFFKFL